MSVLDALQSIIHITAVQVQTGTAAYGGDRVEACTTVATTKISEESAEEFMFLLDAYIKDPNVARRRNIKQWLMENVQIRLGKDKCG